jgi:hypothetical protein
MRRLIVGCSTSENSAYGIIIYNRFHQFYCIHLYNVMLLLQLYFHFDNSSPDSRSHQATSYLRSEGTHLLQQCPIDNLKGRTRRSLSCCIKSISNIFQRDSYLANPSESDSSSARLLRNCDFQVPTLVRFFISFVTFFARISK